MAEANTTVVRMEGREFILEKTFDAPRELVFKAFTEAEHLKHWWGPRGWSMPHCTVDLRPEGVWHYCMKCEDPNQGDFYGMESWGKGVYGTINAPAGLTYTDYFSDAEGGEAEGMPATEVELSFTAEGNKTRVVCRSIFDTEESLRQVMEMGMEQGILETWGRLEDYLPSLAQ